MKRLTVLLMFACALNMTFAAPIVLEDSKVSESDKNAAESVRDNTKAPNSVLGDVGESAVKFAAEASAEHKSSCESGNCNYVTVDFDVVAGLSTEGVDRVFSMSAVDGATGRVEINASKNGAAIFKSINPSVAGEYTWSASWDHGRSACAGQVHVTGTKSTMMIRVYRNCGDAGTREF
jgi:hypothetical protein